MSTLEPDLDAARRLLVERDLTRAAFQHLTVDAFMTLSFEALGPTKGLLKRFFSTEPWDAGDADALADVVGPGEGGWRRQLDPDLTLEYGWENGRFGITIRLTTDEPSALPGAAPAPALAPDDALAASFDGPVVPEATPNPRTIRFHMGTLPPARAGWYESSASARAADDAGVARLASGFDEVVNILVGADFVAVGLRRPADWERLLLPVLKVVTEEFASTGGAPEGWEPRVMGGPSREAAAGGTGPTARRKLTRLDEAWRALGSLHPSEPADLAALENAATGDNRFRRQVAANLLREADPRAAASRWAVLVHDPARSVRRATVDAMVDAAREDLRPLLEEALADADPWVRWKALRGLVELGPSASRDAIRAHADDPDFRVRLEVTAALRAGE
jgi:hypothetical protein